MPLLAPSVRSSAPKERTELEELRRRLNEQRRRFLNERPLTAVGRLCVTLAHELRSPLAYISATAEYLEQKVGKDPALASLTHGIFGKVDRLLKVVEALNALAIGNAGRRRTGILQQSMEHVLEAVDDRCRAHGITVVRAWPDRPLLVYAEHERLQAVLSRLVDNALDAMPEGGTLTLGVEACASAVKVYVEDTGSGISNAHRRKLFQPFFTTKRDASGLSLALCKHWVELSGGKLRYRPCREGKKGSLFLIELPQRTSRERHHEHAEDAHRR